MPIVGNGLVFYFFPYLSNNLLAVAAVTKETATVDSAYVGIHHAVNMNRSGFWSEEIAEVYCFFDAVVGDGLKNIGCGDG